MRGEFKTIVEGDEKTINIQTHKVPQIINNMNIQIINSGVGEIGENGL